MKTGDADMEWFGWNDQRGDDPAQTPEKILERRKYTVNAICSEMMKNGITVDEIEEMLRIRIEISLEALRKTQRT